MTNATVTVKARDFVKAATAALECASKDATVPVLNTVHLIRDGGDLILESTDRYAVVRARVGILPDEESATPNSGGNFGSVLLSAPALKTAIQGIKSTKPAEFIQLCIELSTKDQETTWKLSILRDWSTSGTAVSGQYPKVSGILGGTHPEEGAGVFGVSPDLVAKLSRISKLGDRRQALAISPNKDPRKPIRFTVGADIAGLVMPARLEAPDLDERGELYFPYWATLQPVEQAAPVAVGA